MIIPRKKNRYYLAYFENHYHARRYYHYLYIYIIYIGYRYLVIIIDTYACVYIYIYINMYINMYTHDIYIRLNDQDMI